MLWSSREGMMHLRHGLHASGLRYQHHALIMTLVMMTRKAPWYSHVAGKATSVAFFGAISNGLGKLVNFLSHMHWHHVNYIFKSIVLKVGQTITTHLACCVLA